jgi:hypothetical protein
MTHIQVFFWLYAVDKLVDALIKIKAHFLLKTVYLQSGCV